jgi:hypothetical protein
MSKEGVGGHQGEFFVMNYWTLSLVVSNTQNLMKIKDSNFNEKLGVHSWYCWKALYE